MRLNRSQRSIERSARSAYDDKMSHQSRNRPFSMSPMETFGSDEQSASYLAGTSYRRSSRYHQPSVLYELVDERAAAKRQMARSP